VAGIGVVVDANVLYGIEVTLVYIVFAGNKHPNHDTWYGRAAKEAEAEVDAIRRNLQSKGNL
jgi:hypothetical protein